MASPGQASIIQDDFSSGSTRDVAPHKIDPRAFYDAINGLLDESGSLYKRGGTVNVSGSDFGTTGVRWIWDGFTDAGRRTVFANANDFAVLDADDSTVVNLGSDGLSVPKPSALLEGMLFIGGGHIYAGSRKAASYTTGTVSLTNGSKTVTGSGTTWNTLVDAGMILRRGNERGYVVASIDSTTQLTLRDAYEGATGAGITYSLDPLYKITAADPYESSEFYAVCANRLVRAFGNTVAASVIEKPHDWTETIEGQSIAIQHKLPEGVEINGLATIGLSLLVFSTGGVWVLDGLAFNIVDPAGNPQHRLQLLSRELVLWSAAGIGSWNQTSIVPALDGIYLMDGISQPTRISHPIDELYRTYVQNGYRAGQAVVYRGHYFLPILSAAGSEMRDLLVCRLDRPTKTAGQTAFPWTRFAGAGGSIAAYAVRPANEDADEEPLLLGAVNRSESRVVNCSTYFSPTAEVATDADGSTFYWMLTTRDFETGGNTDNVVRHLKSVYELSGTNSTLSFAYGFGRREDDSDFLWDEMDWGDADDDPDPGVLFWEADETDVFYGLDCEGGTNDGLRSKRCRVNKRARHMRFRITNPNPCSVLRFRSLEVTVRSSNARRS